MFAYIKMGDFSTVHGNVKPKHVTWSPVYGIMLKSYNICSHQDETNAVQEQNN